MLTFPQSKTYTPMGQSGVYDSLIVGQSLSGQGFEVFCEGDGVVIVGANTVNGVLVDRIRHNVQKQKGALLFTADVTVYVMCARWNVQWRWAGMRTDADGLGVAWFDPEVGSDTEVGDAYDVVVVGGGGWGGCPWRRV